MLTPQQLHDYQKECVIHGLTHDDTMMWLQVGLGKTIVSLTVLVDRMRAGQVKKALIVGPLRVIQSVWDTECTKWEHTQHLRCRVIDGTPVERTKKLFEYGDIYLINYENLNWLAKTLDHYYISQGKPLPFEMVVYDEVSKLKNSTGVTMKGGRREIVDARGETHVIVTTGWKKVVKHFKYRMGLTGTPAPNGYIDLHGQYLAVDGGERLGEFITHYRDSYFSSDYMGWKYTPSKLGKQVIEQKISDITKKMDAADYLDIPESKEVNVMVDLPPKTRKAYEEVERDMFTQLDNGENIELFNKVSVGNKCLQFCNGSPYTDLTRETHYKLHDAKLDALEDILEEAAGQPVLCSYTFKSDAERIMKRFKKYKPVNMTTTPANQTKNVIKDWQDGKIGLLIGHPASMGHGVDGLQKNGNILVWFGLNWSLELYLQMTGRLERQGRTGVLTIIRILCNDTMDLVVADALTRKADDQEGLKAAIDRYRQGITTNDLELNFY